MVRFLVTNFDPYLFRANPRRSEGQATSQVSYDEPAIVLALAEDARDAEIRRLPSERAVHHPLGLEGLVCRGRLLTAGKE